MCTVEPGGEINMKSFRYLLGSILAVVPVSVGAAAQGNDSVYVPMFENCDTRQAEDEPIYFSDCPGYGEWMVFVVAAEHGASVSYSDRGLHTQWAEGPPRIGPFQDLGTVMEWRLNADGEAFATIYRSLFFGYQAGRDEGQYLTVSALRPDGLVGGCHVVYVEAATQPGANQIARDAADMLAPDWQCGVDEPVVFDLDSEIDVATLAARRMPGH